MQLRCREYCNAIDNDSNVFYEQKSFPLLFLPVCIRQHTGNAAEGFTEISAGAVMQRAGNVSYAFEGTL